MCIVCRLITFYILNYVLINTCIIQCHFVESDPVIPDCPVDNSIIFPERDQVVPVGCDVVCIREGTRVTLDCTVVSGSMGITYTWTNGDGSFLSNQPTLTVSQPDNYTCNAANQDVPDNREVSLLSCK